MRWLQRDYLAMPGLSHTLPQMRRLLALDEAAYDGWLRLLALTGYLMLRQAGRCVRSPRVELAAWRRVVQTVLNDTQIVETAMFLHDGARRRSSDRQLSMER